MLVPTVTGECDTAVLGRTLMHEHVFVLSPEIQQNRPQLWDEELRVNEAVQKLQQLKRSGIDSIADPTVIGQGRYIPRIQRIAAQVDLRILVATGVYAFQELPHFFRYSGPGTLLGGPDTLTEFLVDEITQGIGTTGVKPAFLKCATDAEGLTPDVRRILRATAAAHRETGAPIMTHTNAPLQTGLLQQEVLAEEGVDLTRVLIGHCGDTTDLEYLKRLLDAGSFIGMDRFGFGVVLPDNERVQTLVALANAGYVDQIVISQDASCHTDYFEDARRKEILPDWHYLRISQAIVPELRARGFDDETLDRILVRNPRRFLEAQRAD